MLVLFPVLNDWFLWSYALSLDLGLLVDEQLRSTRQTSRSDINLYPTLANSTPIRNSNTRSDQPGVHFNTNPTSRNGLQNDNSPNPSDLRNGPTCFRCGEQGHMRAKCRKRVFCNHCRSYNHDTKACRKQHNNILSPTQSQIATGYHPTLHHHH